MATPVHIWLRGPTINDGEVLFNPDDNDQWWDDKLTARMTAKAVDLTMLVSVSPNNDPRNNRVEVLYVFSKP